MWKLLSLKMKIEDSTGDDLREKRGKETLKLCSIKKWNEKIAVSDRWKEGKVILQSWDEHG